MTRYYDDFQGFVGRQYDVDGAAYQVTAEPSGELKITHVPGDDTWYTGFGLLLEADAINIADGTPWQLCWELWLPDEAYPDLSIPSTPDELDHSPYLERIGVLIDDRPMPDELELPELPRKPRKKLRQYLLKHGTRQPDHGDAIEYKVIVGKDVPILDAFSAHAPRIREVSISKWTNPLGEIVYDVAIRGAWVVGWDA